MNSQPLFCSIIGMKEQNDYTNGLGGERKKHARANFSEGARRGVVVGGAGVARYAELRSA